MLKWFLLMSRWQLRKFYPKLRNSRPVKTLIRLIIIKSSETSQVMAGQSQRPARLGCASRSLTEHWPARAAAGPSIVVCGLVLDHRLVLARGAASSYSIRSVITQCVARYVRLFAVCLHSSWWRRFSARWQDLDESLSGAPPTAASSTGAPSIDA